MQPLSMCGLSFDWGNEWLWTVPNFIFLSILVNEN